MWQQYRTAGTLRRTVGMLDKQRRIHRTLSDTNQTLLRLETPERVLAEVTRIAVEDAGFQLAWIGAGDVASGDLVPLAVHGPASGYLDGRRFASDPSQGGGESLPGRAIRNGHPVIVNDLAHGAERHDCCGGLRSAASFPIARPGGEMLTLNVYAVDDGFFTTDIVELLQEMALDIAFALDNYAREDHRRSAEEGLRRSEEHNRLILESAAEGIFGVDQDGVTTFVNPAAARMLGYAPDELIGRSMHAAIHHHYADGSPYPESECPMGQTFRDGATHRATDETLWRKDGTRFPVDYASTPIFKEGVARGAVVTFRDISERKQAEAVIQHQALYDALTDLPNRRLLLDRLDQELARCKRRGFVGAVLFLDLDRFKTINDSLGHPVGDALLVQVAERLTACVRNDDTAARLGGDEFVVLLSEANADPEHTANQANHVANKIRHALGQPYEINGLDLHTTPSIGVALFPMDGESADDVLKQADLAMYRAKESGRNAVRFYLPSMQSAASEQLSLETDLRNAIHHGGLALHYQPQLDRDGRITGAEALARWSHPHRGPITPAVFVRVAEETGLILELGEWVLTEACRQLVQWREEGLADAVPHLAVNVSAWQFRQHDFVEGVGRIIDDTGADAHRLTLELTESVLVGDIDDIAAKMQALKRLGIHFAIDDFGTGYSSLAYLKRLPLDSLKIDRSFVNDLDCSDGDSALVETIIGMARSLSLDVVAEGVETEAQLQSLGRYACPGFQGFLFSRPLPADTFARFVRDRAR